MEKEIVVVVMWIEVIEIFIITCCKCDFLVNMWDSWQYNLSKIYIYAHDKQFNGNNL